MKHDSLVIVHLSNHVKEIDMSTLGPDIDVDVDVDEAEAEAVAFMKKYGALIKKYEDANSIEQMYNLWIELTAQKILKRDPKINERTAVQANMSYPKPGVTAEEIARKQAIEGLEAAALKTKIEDTARLHQRFLETIRGKIKEPVVTALAVQTAIKELKAQFTTMHKARMDAVTTAEKVRNTEQEIARLEKLPQSAPAVAVPPATGKPAVTSALDIAKAALIGLQKAALEAKTLAEKPTDIPAKYESAFMLFSKHNLNGITDDVMFLTERPGYDAKITFPQWDKTLDERKERLKFIDAGALAGITAKAEDWLKKAPPMLTTAQWQMRESKTPYLATQTGEKVHDETKARRDKRREEIRSYDIVATQNAQKRVVEVIEEEDILQATIALNAARKAAKDDKERAKLRLIDFQKFAKQPHELDDNIRQDFEDIGIKKIPKTKQSKIAAGFNFITGNDVWNTDFQARNTDIPQHNLALDENGKQVLLQRDVLEEGVPIPYLPRREHYKQMLTPALQRHLEMGVNMGYLAGKRKDLEKDKYWEPKRDAAMDQLIGSFDKVAISAEPDDLAAKMTTMKI